MTTQTIPQVPVGFLGSQGEFVVYQELVRLGKKVNSDFFYLPGQGFALPPDLAIQVLAIGSMSIGKGVLQKAQMAGAGITLIFLKEDDLLRNAVYFVKEALAYRGHE